MFNDDLPNISTSDKYYTQPDTTINSNPLIRTQVPEPANLPALGLIAVVFGLFRHKRNQATSLK